jgi:hypothetical protein
MKRCTLGSPVASEVANEAKAARSLPVRGVCELPEGKTER